MMGDPPRRFLTRSVRWICAPGARCDYLAHYDMNHSKPGASRWRSSGKSRRGSRPGEPGSVHSVSIFSSPSIARRCLMSSAPAKSMNARTRAERRRSEWVRIQRPRSSSRTRLPTLSRAGLESPRIARQQRRAKTQKRQLEHGDARVRPGDEPVGGTFRSIHRLPRRSKIVREPDERAEGADGRRRVAATRSRRQYTAHRTVQILGRPASPADR